MKTRIIEKDAKNLPACFAVVEGRTVAEGITNLFNAFSGTSRVNLAVWNGAENLLSPQHRADIAEALAANTQTWPSKEEFLFERAYNFTTLRRSAARKYHPAFNAWERSSKAIMQKVHAMGESKVVRHRFVLTKTHERTTLHYDNAKPDIGRLLRTTFGDATLFASPRNVFGSADRPFLRANTRALWTVRPWAIAMIYADDDAKGIVHTVPYAAVTGHLGQPRLLEMLDLSAGRTLIPGRSPPVR